MGVSKKGINLNSYKRNGALKKSGLNYWRFVFNGIENGSGTEKTFFIELSMLNPWLSPSSPVLGFKTVSNISEEELQNVLAGTAAAQQLKSESFVTPSYVTVRAGILGAGAKQICEYSAVRNIKISNRVFEIDTGKCYFSEEKLSGAINCSPEDLREHPEFLCNSGAISWELRYEIKSSFKKGFKGKNFSWFATGAKNVFAGSITVDGKTYNVIPRNSYGYIDRNWGKTPPETRLHISASNLTSIISGRTMPDSYFAVQGVYNDRLALMLNLGRNNMVFPADSAKHSYESLWDCSQMPEDDDGEKLHWSISVNNKMWVVDIDVFALTSQLFVRSIELPEGSRKTMKILCGISNGEIRLYKRVHKTLELIEHAHIANALCEFGQTEMPEL